MILTLTLISLLVGIAIYLVFGLWRQKIRSSLRITAAIFGLLLSSSYLAIREYGVEFGVIYFFLIASALALTIVALNTQLKTVQRVIPKDIQTVNPSLKSAMHHSWNFVVVILMCLTSSLFVTIYATHFFIQGTVAQLASIIIIFPILWGTLAYVFLMLEGRKRNLASAALTTLSSLFIATAYIQ